jgi:phage terminase large subunit-like protein
MPRRRPKPQADTLAGTRAWVRDAADERAVTAGCRFDPERAAFVCDWIEQYCRLYEGELAGEPFLLLPFQRDFLSRLFGWVRWSSEWKQWVRRFTHGAFWAAKKNGKSPLAAAVNLYLLAGDGEAGQKVYQAAKNGDQARIAQRHAVEMVKQSPELAADCKINNSTLTIQHLPSSSVLMILTGDDSRGAKSKEGLNGSVTFDEMHVVDREMYERTSRAGISRKEPFILSYSTAGDDPSSVGYERCQYGRQVSSGERDDMTFLHVEYSAPESLSEADIEADLDAFGRAANPAWGEIVKPSEFRADWQRSKGSTREVARFFQYRGNRWIGSTNRWLDVRGWDSGKRGYTLADLAGRECYVGIDLSRTRDMTACVFTFPESDERVKLWPLFWMPEQTARERDHLFPFLSWAHKGFLSITRGGVVDYNKVKSDIRLTVSRYNLRVIRMYYDPHYAEEITQQLADGERLGDEIADGIGGERVAFPQTLMSLTGPAKEFERRVQAGFVEHPDNEVLSWMAGHCETWGDNNNNIRPVKPKPNSGKCVDGIMAGVMTFAELLTQQQESFVSPSLWTVDL